jgi:allantoinase
MTDTDSIELDWLISGGEVVTPKGTEQATIGLLDGQIVALDANVRAASRQTYDASGKVVIPGLVDPHAHFWDPGATHREDWRHGSMSALAGGVTTVIEMPLSIPPTIDARSLEQKQKRVQASSLVNAALWGGVVPAPPEVLEERMRVLVNRGVRAFKVFMCSAAEEFPACGLEDVARVLRIAKKLGVLIGVHAEDSALVHSSEAKAQKEGRHSALDFAKSPSKTSEVRAVQQLLDIIRDTGAEAYIVHMSAAEAVELVAEAKASGVRVYAETCPHYLVLDTDDLLTQGPWAKCAPPLRDRDNVEKLWGFVLDGTIDTIGSDHAPFSVSEKEARRIDIWSAPNGLVGIQTMLPLLVHEGIQRRGMSWARLVQVTSRGANNIFRLGGKGEIAVGRPADLAIVDQNGSWPVRGDTLFSLMKWTPYEGMVLNARVAGTFLAGDLVYDGANVADGPQCSRMINMNDR